MARPSSSPAAPTRNSRPRSASRAGRGEKASRRSMDRNRSVSRTRRRASPSDDERDDARQRRRDHYRRRSVSSASEDDNRHRRRRRSLSREMTRDDTVRERRPRSKSRERRPRRDSMERKPRGRDLRDESVESRDRARRDRSGGRRDRSRDRRPRDRSRERRKRGYSDDKRSPSPRRRRSRSRSPRHKRRKPSRSPSPERSRSRSPRHRRRKISRSPRRSRPKSTSRSPVRRQQPLPSQLDAFRGNPKSKPSTPGDGPPQEKQKPNFSQTGLLARETNTVTRGGTSIVLKYHEPPEARKPPASQQWRLYIFKGDDLLDTVPLHARSCWLVGRAPQVADLLIEHPSSSQQHAAIQFRFTTKTDEWGEKSSRVRPYLIDLESSNGTWLNGDKVPPASYVELRDKDLIKFGLSEREYVVMLPPPDKK